METREAGIQTDIQQLCYYNGYVVRFTTSSSMRLSVRLCFQISIVPVSVEVFNTDVHSCEPFISVVDCLIPLPFRFNYFPKIYNA